MGEVQNPGASRSDADDLSGAHPDKRPARKRVRTSGPGKGKKSDTAHLVVIAQQALQGLADRLASIPLDAPKHERDRLLIPVVSDAGLAVRSVNEAIWRWQRGLL